ncbi:hypothetical protein GCM10009841_09680 [Microlunatus panaciterrae]|uniref:Peptidoglycan hydrolase-like protein with peptidoglycan-binding domain n=1 Tax=Microlunatus panaciterrae TaxID=400768 RepID=A0ABS2RMU9_9ACTN|nr:peptidoglycan-binding protein [Microlunatus panaciterrae]MBM7799516.1 peptidoglycan hydrolase-like protein with peptidoglycan-binding domain [Microlunatus panaciterrae]
MRRILKMLVGTGASFALAATVMIGAPPAASAAQCTVTFNSYHTVRHGTKGRQTRAVECLLRSAGYHPRMNSYLSRADVSKVKSFQRRSHLSATGSVDSHTWAALLSRGSRPTLSVGSRGASVQRLQRALTASGLHVPATGYYGSMTRNAVRSLQGAHRWHRTGKATGSVWQVLQHGGSVKAAAKAKKASPKKRTTVTKKKKVASSAKGRKALAFAKKQLGDSYRYGATGPNSWDCSGLTSGAWKAAGVKLPRTSQAQFRVGKRVSKSHLRPGDLVFFYSGIRHVAIYAGNGKVIHASRPGTPVQYLKMKYMPYMGARRPA